MKNKLQIRIAAAILLFIVTIGTATAQTNNRNASGTVDPVTGLPIQAVTGNVPGAIDPATGLPVRPPAIQWIDSDWGGSGTILPEINFDGLPLSEVARELKEKFTNDFDIIFPNIDTSLSTTPIYDTRNATVTLQLKNVTAIEVFNAMNLQLEAGNVPIRCKLLMNGSRPTVMVTVLPQALPPAPEIKRMVFFVGGLLRQNNSSNIVDTIAHVWDSSGLTSTEQITTDAKTDGHKATIYFHHSSQPHETITNAQGTVSANYPSDSTGQIQIYLPAQLLIISGTSAQIELAQQTLEALKQKEFTDSDSIKPNPPSDAAAGPK